MSKTCPTASCRIEGIRRGRNRRVASVRVFQGSFAHSGEGSGEKLPDGLPMRGDEQHFIAALRAMLQQTAPVS